MESNNKNNDLFDIFSRKLNEWDLLIELQGLLKEYGTCSIEPLGFKEENEHALVLMLNDLEYWVEEQELEQVLCVLKEESGIVMIVNEDGELELFEPESAPHNIDDLPF